MATTRLIAMHVNKRKTVAQSLKDRIDYAVEPDKTDDGALVSSFACDPKTADAEFLLAKREYRMFTGRERKKEVIAYQVRQSFKPGEVSPEEANRIGYELASRFLKGNHAFIVATHIDKKHVHNHIIWNSTSLDCHSKFRNFIKSGQAVARLSDQICMEHQLSVITNPKEKGSKYNKWLGDNDTPSQRDSLCMVIDAALEQKPSTFDSLLVLLQKEGIEIKRGKQLAIRKAGQARFKRLDTLGDSYVEAALRATIAGTNEHKPRKDWKAVHQKKQVSMIVDIQEKMRAGKGAGYERWAKVFNLKQMAQSVTYLSEHGISDYAELERKAADASTTFNALGKQIRGAEERLAEIAVLKTHILNYMHTKDAYAEYRKSGYSKKVAEKYASEISMHKASKKAFDELGVTKLPTVKSLQSEYSVLLAEKKSAYVDYKQAKEQMQEMLTVKANVDQILGKNERKNERENQHDH